jgi:uncharacterized DUF497 family protein
MDFRWNDWNVEHIGGHGVSPEEAEMLVRTARGTFLRELGEDKWLVWGRGRGGRFLQAIFVLDHDETVYVIHARPLTNQEKRRYHRRKRR